MLSSSKLKTSNSSVSSEELFTALVKEFHFIIDGAIFLSVASLQIFFRKLKLKFWIVNKERKIKHDLIHRNK